MGFLFVIIAVVLVIAGMLGASTLTHVWTQTIKNDTGTAIVNNSALTIIGNAEENFSVSVDPGLTVEVDIAITVAKIISGFIVSDQAVTVNTNAADATGGQTFAIAAARAYAWNNAGAGMGSTPFTTNITKFYVINAGTKTAKVRGGFLIQNP